MGTVGVNAKLCLSQSFGQDKYPMICKNAGRSVVEAAHEAIAYEAVSHKAVSHEPASYEAASHKVVTKSRDSSNPSMIIAHAYYALRFLLDYGENHEIKSCFINIEQLIFPRDKLGTLDLSARYSYYQFLNAALDKYPIATESILSESLFEYLLLDLRNVGPAWAKQSCINLLSQYQIDGERKVKLLRFIQEATTVEVPKNEISNLARLLEKLPSEEVVSSLEAIISTFAGPTTRDFWLSGNCYVISLANRALIQVHSSLMHSLQLE